MKKLVFMGGVMVVSLGMVWTILGDYLPWKKAETENFGHGPGEMGITGIVNTMYQESGAGVRINYPKGWKVRTVWGLKGWKPVTDVVIFTPPENDAKVKISRFEVTGSLVDEADKMMAEKKSLGWMAQERQYISAAEDITVLTWNTEESRVRQTAMAKNGKILVTVEIECTQEEWKDMLGIFWEMYKSLVII